MTILDSELDLTKYYKIKYLTDIAMTELCSKNNSKRKKILKKEKKSMWKESIQKEIEYMQVEYQS